MFTRGRKRSRKQKTDTQSGTHSHGRIKSRRGSSPNGLHNGQQNGTQPAFEIALALAKSMSDPISKMGNTTDIDHMNHMIQHETETNRQASLEDRTAFALQAQQYFDSNDILMQSIHDAITQINNREDMLAVVYGGRAWAHCLDPYLTRDAHTTPAQFGSALKGNIDLLILSNDPLFFSRGSETYINIARGWLEQLKTRIGTDYRVEISAGYPPGTLTNSPLVLYCAISSLAHSPIPNLVRKMLFYIELNTKPIDIQLFRRLFIKSAVQPRLQPAAAAAAPAVAPAPYAHLNSLGLFLFSFFMDSEARDIRQSDKALPVDSIRTHLFRTHLLKGVIDITHQADATYLIAHLVFVLYPAVFNLGNPACAYYRHKQGLVLDELLTRFQGIVKITHGPALTPGDGQMTYNDFKKWVGSRVLLDAPRGTSNETIASRQYPSARQLFQHAITLLNVASSYGMGSVGKCMKVGGDAIRHYDADVIMSMDIDAKYYYHVHAAQRMYKYAIALLVFITQRYLEAAKYFTIESTYQIQIGEIPFRYEINSSAQQTRSRTRFLPKFIVPLTSIDVRLNARITAPAQHIHIMPVKMRLAYAPLDISLISKTAPEVQDAIDNEIPFLLHDGDNLNAAAPTMDGENFYYPSVASFGALHADLKYITTNFQSVMMRNANGKREKDIDRLRTFESIYNQPATPQLVAQRTHLNMLQSFSPNATHILRTYDRMAGAIMSITAQEIQLWSRPTPLKAKKTSRSQPTQRTPARIKSRSKSKSKSKSAIRHRGGRGRLKIQSVMKKIQQRIAAHLDVVGFIQTHCKTDAFALLTMFNTQLFQTGGDNFTTEWSLL